LACAGVRGTPTLKANPPIVNTVARYFFMVFSFDFRVVNYFVLICSYMYRPADLQLEDRYFY
jgi:hypothetical protein